ncbi:Arsenate reductase [Roseobacter fucihabitans]|uniref:Arsenate reductase n=1 Tax=Roseobacter fucihabitans TaxID=1537242 RepID=A0ABZ2BRE2_9RHOB|nr:ArsR family transcriptional regulator [Roseobacter litoralis]MBC6964484.1 Arsenate-mycothiol transferase ArsC1 [Roseobacter litoralis]
MELEALSRLSALSHPQRLAVFRLLMRRFPDAVPAGEISAALELKASTASVYLSALCKTHLITQDRVGTSLRYRANTQAAGALIEYIFTDCCRGRPELCPPFSRSPEQTSPVMPGPPYNVLFICTGNSARSIFAESILHDLEGTSFTAYSAGTAPGSELNPVAVDLLRAKGHDTSRLRAKHISEFQSATAPRMDFVFTVCDSAANEECPAWDGQPISGHWGVPDPVAATGTLSERQLAFQHAYGALKNRIEAFAALPLATHNRISLQAAVDDIAAHPLEGTCS